MYNISGVAGSRLGGRTAARERPMVEALVVAHVPALLNTAVGDDSESELYVDDVPVLSG